MSIETKREMLLNYCRVTPCNNCKLKGHAWKLPISIDGCLNIEESPEEDLDNALLLIVDSKDSDIVNRPAHYTDGKIEVIEYIEDKKLGFCLGNAIKYISRAGKKDPAKEIEDLQKAKWYIERRIKELEEGE